MMISHGFHLIGLAVFNRHRLFIKALAYSLVPQFCLSSFYLFPGYARCSTDSPPDRITTRFVAFVRLFKSRFFSHLYGYEDSSAAMADRALPVLDTSDGIAVAATTSTAGTIRKRIDDISTLCRLAAEDFTSSSDDAVTPDALAEFLRWLVRSGLVPLNISMRNLVGCVFRYLWHGNHPTFTKFQQNYGPIGSPTDPFFYPYWNVFRQNYLVAVLYKKRRALLSWCYRSRDPCSEILAQLPTVFRWRSDIARYQVLAPHTWQTCPLHIHDWTAGNEYTVIKISKKKLKVTPPAQSVQEPLRLPFGK